MNQGGRKKVLFVITKSNWGGAQRYVYDLSTRLPKDTYDVAVAYGSKDTPGESGGQLAALLREAGVRGIFIPELGRDVSAAKDYASLRALCRILQAERPDVLHLNSSKAGGLGALAGRLCGVPRIIFTAHGWPFWEKRSAPARVLIFLLSWVTLLLSHKTICVSEYDKRHISWMPGVSNKVAVVHNGIEAFSMLPREEARENSPEHTHDLWIGTIAELHPNKDLETAITATATYNSTSQNKAFYIIIGNGEQEAYLTRRAIRELGYAHIRHIPAEARRWLRAFDVFLLTSKKEGLPYVLLEAGIAGIPVIASNVGGIPEIVESGVNGILCTPGDTEAFARAIGTLLRDPALRERMGATLAKTVRERFSLENMVNRTTALYRA